MCVFFECEMSVCFCDWGLGVFIAGDFGRLGFENLGFEFFWWSDTLAICVK